MHEDQRLRKTFSMSKIEQYRGNSVPHRRKEGKPPTIKGSREPRMKPHKSETGRKGGEGHQLEPSSIKKEKTSCSLAQSPGQGARNGERYSGHREGAATGIPKGEEKPGEKKQNQKKKKCFKSRKTPSIRVEERKKKERGHATTK